MITESKIQLTSQTINYFKAGAETNSNILLLHGLGTRASFWLPIIPFLVDAGYQVYAPDLPGFGYSDSAVELFSPTYMGSIVNEFVETLNLSSVIIVGHSMGGAMAGSFAISHPQIIKALILVDAYGLCANTIPLSPSVLYKLSLPSLYYRLTRQSEKLIQPIIESNFHDPERLSPEILEMAIRENWLDRSSGRTQAVLGLAAHLGSPPQRKKFRQQLRDQSRQFRFPILLIWGQEDNFIPVDGAHQLKKEIPEIELHIISNCGHVPPLERTEEFNHQVMQFITSLS